MYIGKKVSGNRKLWLLLFLYKCAIEVAYYFVVSQVYGSVLFWNPNGMAFFISTFLMLILVATMPADVERASFYVCLLFDILSVIPMLSLYWMINQKSYIIAMVAAMDVIIHLLLRIPVRKKIVFQMEGKRSAFFINIIFALYIFTVIYFVIRSNGINIQLLTLNDDTIYSVREENNYGSFIMPYIFEWDQKVLFPFFFGIGLYEKKKIYIVLSFVSQILLFLCYGNKLTILTICLMMAIYISLKFKKRYENVLTSGIAVVMAMLPILYAVPILQKIGKVINWLVAMRTIFMPAMIKFNYFDFFSSHEYLFFSEGQIGRLLGIEYPYDRAIGVVISNYFYGEGSGNNNTGVIADAYANMGFAGMILIAVIFVISFRIIDSFTGHFPLKVKILVISLFAVYMNDNAFLTTLLTNGLFVMIVIVGIYNVAFMRRKGVIGCKKERLYEV